MTFINSGGGRVGYISSLGQVLQVTGGSNFRYPESERS